MNSPVARVIAFLACLCLAFAYGMFHELADPSNAVEWGAIALSVLLAAGFVTALHHRAGLPLLLAAPALSMAWTAAVLGNFLPFAAGLGGRVLNDYNYDISWQVWLIINVAFSALAGLAAGLLATVLAAGLLALGRTRVPGCTRPSLR